MFKVVFPCCFCAKEIEKTEIDPCSISVATDNGRKQFWSCHSACFKAALNQEKKMKEIFEPTYF